MASLSRLLQCRQLISRQAYRFPVHLSAARSIHGPPKVDEYNKEAHYPKIDTHTTVRSREEENLSEFVKSLKTVEEKQWYLNKPKYYGWYSRVVNAKYIKYGSLDFVQYATNTTLVDGKLPDRYGSVLKSPEASEENVESPQNNNLLPIDIEAKQLAQEIEPILKAFLVNTTQHWERSQDVERDKVAYHESHARLTEEMGVKIVKRKRIQLLVSGIHRIVFSHLAQKKSYLSEATIDHLPRTEAFWFRGGFPPDARMLRKRIGKYETDKRKKNPRPFPENKIHEEYDQAIQVLGDTILQMRCDKMLSPFVDNVAQDEVCQSGPVPSYKYNLSYTGYSGYCQHGSNIAGHWTGSPTNFGHLSFVNALNNYQNNRNEASWSQESEYADHDNMMLTKAILSSFAILMPNACYQGFSPLNDPTHPFCTQTVVTDGQKFKFCVLQLNNTALLNVDTEDKTVTRNVCWHLPEQELFSSIDENGIHDFNSNVLETLIKFYLSEPTVDESEIDNRDYLGEHKYIHNLKNTYNREYFTNAHRFLYSKREKHLAKPDILAYQRIFMINHPEQMFLCGNREQLWFKMAQVDFKGKEHWHPEFKALDSNSQRQIKKFRKNKWDIRVKKVYPPIPADEIDEMQDV